MLFMYVIYVILCYVMYVIYIRCAMLCYVMHVTLCLFVMSRHVKSVVAQDSTANSASSDEAKAYRRERRRSSSVRPNRLLFSNDFTRSMNQDWQSGQFSCQQCSASLTGQRYILHDEKPYCKKCYESLFANTCDKCKTKITCDYRDLSYKV